MFGHDQPQITIVNLDADQGEHWHHLFRLLAEIRESQMTVSKVVQDALDGITQTISLEQSVVAGLALQGTQIADLKAQIAALQGQAAQIGPDDLAALATITTDIGTVNTALQAAIPANTAPASTPPAAAPAPADAPAPLPGTSGQT